MMSDDSTPGQLVRAARKRRGWSQAKLASVARVSQGTVSRYERDEPHQLSSASVLMVAIALGIDARALDPAFTPYYEELPEGVSLPGEPG